MAVKPSLLPTLFHSLLQFHFELRPLPCGRLLGRRQALPLVTTPASPYRIVSSFSDLLVTSPLPCVALYFPAAAWRTTIGLTSIDPTFADGIRSAIAIASAWSFASIM